MPPSAFLSFSSQDRELAQEIYQGLLGRGIEVWKAPENIPPGMDWAAAIHAAIAQQQVFLLLWSDAAMASAEVSKEIRLAASQARSLLLPVRLTAAMPHGTQDYHLGGIQWLEGQGLPLPDLLDRIEARIRDLVESGQHSAAPAAKTARARGSAWRQRVLQGLVGMAALAAVAFDLNPWLPPNQWLLDQRLFWQARWRQLTDQLGPTPFPIGLVPLSSPVYGQLGVEPTDGSVNQAVLAKVLQALPNNSAQLVGLDFILDGPGANPAGHRSLAAVIKQQPASRQIVAGLCPPNAVAVPNCLKALDQRLAGSLATAGARPVSITLGMRTEDLPPLQLIEPIREGSFAWAMAADAPRGGLPTEAVIDWSVNWLASQRLQLIQDRQALQQFKGVSLIVASDGYEGRQLNQPADQHPAPRAVWAYGEQGTTQFSTLQSRALPGGAVQAVLAQSIRSGHWLEPLLPFGHSVSAAVLGLLGWWAGGLRLRRRWLVLAAAAAAVVYSLLALQLLVSLQRLLPLALPLVAGAGMMAVRKFSRLRP